MIYYLAVAMRDTVPDTSIFLTEPARNGRFKAVYKVTLEFTVAVTKKEVTGLEPIMKTELLWMENGS